MRGQRIGRYIGFSLVLLFLALEVYPILWLLSASLKAPTEFVTRPSFALPTGFYLKNYVDAWTVGRMGTFFVNSVVATSLALVLIVVLSLTVSFAIAKMKWRLSRVVFGIFLAGILVPVQVVLIPLFVIFRTIGIINTLGGLSLIYASFGMSMSVFLMSSYLRYVPDELLEAAIVDGCNVYQILVRVVLPLATNAIMTVLVIQFFVTWNDLIFSMTFISSRTLKTVQTGLLYFQDDWGNRDWGPIYAAIAISVVPTISLYAILNKLVIRGMTEGAVKG
jgi:raffinose/stachyose/melibiose transport system permease protein